MARRIALAAAIILVASILVLPPVLGARARSLLEPSLNAAGASLAPNAALAISFEDWDAGWFTSTSTATLEAVFRTPPPIATVSPEIDETYRATLPGVVTLHHGPVPLGGLAGLGWGSAEFVVDATAIPESQVFHAETGIREAVRLTALVGFLGNTTIGLSLRPISTTEPSSGAETRFAGLDATLSLGQDGTRTASTGTLYGLSATLPDGTVFEIGESSWAGRGHRDSAAGLWLGDGSATLAKIVASGAGAASAFELDDAHIETDLDIDDEVVVGVNRSTAVGVRLRDIQLDDVEIGITMKTPVAAMASLSEDTDRSGSDRSLPADLIAAMLKQPAALRIDPLAFEYREMPLNATLDVVYEGDRHAGRPALNFDLLTGVTYAELHLSIHKNLLGAIGIDALAKLVPAMARLDLVRESGDEYLVHATYRDGELLFDGKPVELPLLVALMAGV